MKNSITGTEQADNLAATGSGRGVLVVVCIAMFFGVLNASAVGVVLPEIARDLSAETAQIGWLMALGLSLVLPSIVKPEVSNDEPTVETLTVMKWTPNCSVPWHPECVEILATDPVAATR